MYNSKYLGYKELAGDDFKYNNPNLKIFVVF